MRPKYDMLLSDEEYAKKVAASDREIKKWVKAIAPERPMELLIPVTKLEACQGRDDTVKIKMPIEAEGRFLEMLIERHKARQFIRKKEQTGKWPPPLRIRDVP